MTIEKFLAILIKRWWLILICCGAVGLGAYIGSRLMPRLYQSTALIQIAIRPSNTQGDYYTSLLASEQLVQTETTLATSDPVLREVASHYPGMTVEQLLREVTAAPKLNTQLFEIDVQNSSPTKAAMLANDVAGTLITQQTQAFKQNAVQSDIYLLTVQPAQPSYNPVQPHVLLNTGGGLAIGLLLGMLLAVLLDLLDTRVLTPVALTQLLGWPVLATIWQARSKKEVFNPKGKNANLEAYRILRTNIGFTTIDKPVHTLAITSIAPREGKSIIAANLAIFMARAGKKTLLIDSDLRRPALSKLFGIPGDKMGLSNAILSFSISSSSGASTNQMLRTSNTSIPLSSMPPILQESLDPFIHDVNIRNLCVMPSGPLPPNPSELLDSKAMLRFFKTLSNCGVEIVIFDTCPLHGLSDASILASKVDGTLVVVDITRAKKASLMEAKTLLAQSGARILGSVINKQRRNRKDTIYSYYSVEDEQEEEGTNVDEAGSFPSLLVTPCNLGETETLSRLSVKEENEKRQENHSINTVNTQVVPADASDANSETIKLSKDNVGSKGSN